METRYSFLSITISISRIIAEIIMLRCRPYEVVGGLSPKKVEESSTSLYQDQNLKGPKKQKRDPAHGALVRGRIITRRGSRMLIAPAIEPVG